MDKAEYGHIKWKNETYLGVTFIADSPFTQFTDLTPRTEYAEPGFHTQEAHLKQKVIK